MNANQFSYSIGSIVVGEIISMQIDNEITGESVKMPVNDIAKSNEIIDHMTPDDVLTLGFYLGKQQEKAARKFHLKELSRTMETHHA